MRLQQMGDQPILTQKVTLVQNRGNEVSFSSQCYKETKRNEVRVEKEERRADHVKNRNMR